MADPTTVRTAGETARIDVFDGLRGIAIILVVLSHGWLIWPTDFIYDHRPLSSLFRSGNYAVSIFFAVGAFVATRALVRRAQSPAGLHPGVDLIRRYLRLTGQIAVLMAAIMLVSVLDDTDAESDAITRTSVLHVLSYTWNWYLQTNSLLARADLGHLWYLSVYLQTLVLVTLLVWLLRRRPVWLAVTLAGLIVASEIWTRHITSGVSDPGLFYQALLRTSVRIDAPLSGALAAVLLPLFARFRQYAAWSASIALVSLVPLAYFTTPPEGYFGAPGLVLDVALLVFCAGTVLAPLPRFLAVPLGWRPLAFLGARSYGLYIWHLPVFFYMARHFLDLGWGWRTTIALTTSMTLAILSEWLVEPRVRRALASPAWRELDYGIPAYLARRWRSRSTRASKRETASSEIPSRRLTRS